MEKRSSEKKNLSQFQIKSTISHAWEAAVLRSSSELLMSCCGEFKEISGQIMSVYL